MTPVFADTSFYLALLNRRDRYHAQARELFRTLHRPQITTDFVLVEVGNALSGIKTGRERFGGFAKAVFAHPQVTVLEASRERVEQGLILYRSRVDKTWSLTDCISIAAMREMGLCDTLTADHHFEQAGFVVLLK